MNEVPFTELGFVDIRKYVYDSLLNYVSLIEKMGPDKVIIRKGSVSKIKRPFVSISQGGGNTNNIGIREQEFQIDIWSTSIEESDSIKDIIIDLFNRRNFKGIKSKILREIPGQTNEKTGNVRQILDFLFVFKDMKY